MIRGTSDVNNSRIGNYSGTGTKGASIIDNSNPKPKITLRYRPILTDKQKKLKELGKMIRDF